MKTETRISGMCILIVGACAVDPGGDVRVPPEVAQVSSVEVDLDGVRVDLGTLMERTRNAFVDRGGRLVGGRATYGVEAAGARISIRWSSSTIAPRGSSSPGASTRRRRASAT